MFDAAACAFIAETESCQACWKPANSFLTTRGESLYSFTVPVAWERAKELVFLQSDKGPGASRLTLPPGKTAIAKAQALYHETHVLGQYLNKMSGLMLPELMTVAWLRPVPRDRVLCLVNVDPHATYEHKRVHIPAQLRAPLVQRTLCGKFASYFD